MNRTLRIHGLALASATLMGLAACGGGGGGGQDAAVPAPTPGPVAPAAVTLSGTVATGAAFEGATLRVTDRTGAEVARIASLGADGLYRVTLAEGAQAPFVLTAERDGTRLVSVHDAAASGTVNVTPVTTLIAARLSPSGDPGRLAAEVAGGSARIDAAALASRLDEVRTLLRPLLQATGTEGEDLLRGSFHADGQGHDRLLDSLKITITPDSDRSANVQVTVRQRTDDGQEPPEIRFNTADGGAPPALPAVSAEALVAEGTSTLVADLIARLNACYALPVTERVDSTAATAAAANVVAAACRQLFVGGDPAGYLHNGQRVGTSAAFGGLFRAGATGLTFSRGTYEFSRANGDLVVGYTTTNPNTQNSTDAGAVVARRITDAATGRTELRLVGNQYAYDGGVSAYHQRRRFSTLGQSAWDYHSVGYTLNVGNQTDGTGQPLFDRVVVTSPRGQTLVLRPTAGSAYLVLTRANGSPTGTSFVRLRSRYIAQTTPGHPNQRDTGLFFAQNDLDDRGVADLSAHSVWKFEYYLASDPTRLAATQHYKTRARPLTVAELAQRGMATLADADLASLASRADPATGRVPLPTDAGVTLNWTVPAGALAPTQLKLWGRSAAGAAFNDQESALPTARTGTIACSRQTAADAHCDATNARLYAAGATADGIHLWSRDADGREFASFHAMYKVAP